MYVYTPPQGHHTPPPSHGGGGNTGHGTIYIYGYTGQSGLWVGNQCPHSILNIAHQQGIWYPTKISKNAKVGSKMGMGRDGKSQN